MWDIENGQINTLRNNTHTYQALNNVVISPNAKMVAFSSPSMDAPKITYDAHGNYIYVETQINVFHMNEQNKMFSIEDLNKGVSAIKFTPDSMKIIFWEKDYGDLHISDVEKGQINRDFYESGNISSISISPDGKRVIVCAQDVDVFDVNTGHELHTFQRGWWKEWRPAKISLDGRLAFVPALVVGKDRYSVLKQDNLPLAVIDIENGNILNLFSRLDENIYGLEVMPDNDHILLGDDRGYIQLWSLWEDKCQKTFKAHEGTVCSIKASPDGNYIISSDHEVVHFWNLLSGKCVKKINLNSSDFPVVSDFDKKVKISADGRYVLILQERRISIFNLKKGDCIATLAPPDGITAFDLKNELIVCNQGGDIVSYHFKNFEPIIPVATPVRMWQFEKQGKTIAIGDWEDRITVDCKWCGQRFPVEDETLEMIKCIVRETSIDKQKKSCNSKLDKTRKLLNCSNCKQYLQFSPFIVDNSEKDYLSGSKIRKYCSHIYEHFRLSFKRSFNKYGKWLNRWFEIDRIHHYYFKSGFEFVAKKEDDLLPSIEDVQEAYDDEYRNSYYEICKHVNEITKQISLITISWLMSSVGIALFLIKDSIYEKIIAGSIYGFVLVYPVACFQAWRFFRQGLTGPQGIVVVFMKMLIYGSIYEKIIARLIYTFVVFVLNYHTACIQAWKNFRQGLKGTKEIAIKFMGFLAAHFVLIGLILIFSFIERFWIFLIGSGFSLGYYVIFAKALIVGILAPFIIISSGVLSALNHRHIFWRNLAKILWTRIIVKCRFRGRSKLQVPIYMIPLLFYILSPAIISGVTLAFFELIFFALSIQYLIHSRINK
jgi:WD40 repeat protein